MSELKLMLVEDDAQDVKTCLDSLKVYTDKNKREIDIIVCKSVDEAKNKLDNTFDGAIVDLKLGKDSKAGNAISTIIGAAFYRIPVIVFTATPGDASEGMGYLETCKKGEVEYSSVFDKFYDIYNTGLTRIMGGRGKIEAVLNSVFMKNILPQKEIWIEYGKKDAERTEKSLLRHIINHLMLLLDEEDPFFPDEVYIYPPVSDQLYTGSIIKEKHKEKPEFVVLTPACDLVIRKDGNFKTDRLLLIEIDAFEQYNEKGKIDKRLSNSLELYLHCLPKTNRFAGGLLNFRKISTKSIDEYNEHYDKPYIQISPSFVKDIISRFSSYYARQGQPDIDKELLHI